MELINAARREYGLAPFDTGDTDMHQLARVWADDAYAQGSTTTTSPLWGDSMGFMNSFEYFPMHIVISNSHASDVEPETPFAEWMDAGGRNSMRQILLSDNGYTHANAGFSGSSGKARWAVIYATYNNYANLLLKDTRGQLVAGQVFQVDDGTGSPTLVMSDESGKIVTSYMNYNGAVQLKNRNGSVVYATFVIDRRSNMYEQRLTIEQELGQVYSVHVVRHVEGGSDGSKKEPVASVHVTFIWGPHVLDCADDDLQRGMTNADGVINCPNAGFGEQELLRIKISDPAQELGSFDKFVQFSKYRTVVTVVLVPQVRYSLTVNVFDAKGGESEAVCQDLKIRVICDGVALYEANLAGECQAVFSNPSEVEGGLQLKKYYKIEVSDQTGGYRTTYATVQQTAASVVADVGLVSVSYVDEPDEPFPDDAPQADPVEEPEVVEETPDDPHKPIPVWVWILGLLIFLLLLILILLIAYLVHDEKKR